MDQESLYDNIADAYDQWVSTSDDVLTDAAFAELIDPAPGSRVCAVGCGAGREARYLARRGAVVTGVDLSERLLAIAREREMAAPLGITYLRDDAHTLAGLGDATFEGAVCYMALMDIPDLERALNAIARILIPGGWFVLAITHPCFKPPAYGELVDHVDGSVRRTVGKYFAEGPWDGPGKRTDHLPSRAYHRTLSTYVNTLISSGFTLESLREPMGETGVWREAAQLLYARCRKSAANHKG
ncbi:MAG: methyltransferase domain-containing protein [Thermomicrobiales bacterium]